MRTFDVGDLPLSSAQYGIWIDTKIHPRDTSYSLAEGIELRGPLNTDLLIRAIRQVVSEVTSLRLEFFEHDGEPRQRLAPEREVAVTILDFSSLPKAYEEAQAWMTADAAMSFDVQKDVLFRNAVIRVSDDCLYWYRNYHHLIVDGMAMRTLLTRVADIYCVLEKGESVIASCDMQHYLAHLDDDLNYRTSERYALDQDYWKAVYREPPEPTTLSSKGVLSADQRVILTAYRLAPDALFQRCSTLARSTGLSLGRFFLICVALFVHRMTGARDVPLCVPVHGRAGRTRSDLIAMCANVVAINVSVDASARILDQIRDLNAQLATALTHRRYRYEDLKRQLGLRPGVATPFRVQANVIDGSIRYFGKAHVASFKTFSSGAIDDLSVTIYPDEVGFSWVVAGNSALYRQWEVEIYAQLFGTVLESIVSDPGKMVRRITLLSEREQQQMSAWNDTAGAYPDGCFHELFEKRAAIAPDAVAIETDTEVMTYQALDARANQLAHYLRKCGVETESVVGVCVPRSIDMFVAVLGVMKSGAAYLPLDVSLPSERIAFMVADADARIVLTHLSHATLLPANVQRIDVDFDWPEIAEMPATPPCTQISPGNLAYVIYTSGSTGSPKGVLVEHKGLCNLAHALASACGVRPTSRVLQFSRLSFDASVFEFSMTFHAGATLCLMESDQWDVAQILKDRRVNIALLPPSLLAQLLEGDFDELRTLVVGGEACPSAYAERWGTRCALINAYGPTEATVCATVHAYAGGDDIPIGRPLQNTRIYILDSNFDPLPIGVIGELFIGGVGVARGYLNRQDLTREKFLRDPFAGEADARMYRTGDRGRYLPDGSIQFFGRIDDQVKVRGYRIELGEIEARLLQHPSIRQAAVVVQGKDEQRRLVAYVVSSSAMNAAEVRAYLAQQLPEYMSQLACVFLDQLPMTANGKLDRRGLPALSAADSQCTVKPRTALEAELVGMWQDVLGVSEIGVEDDFFDLGGTSLSALRLIGAIKGKYGMVLDLRTLFSSGTIVTVANEIRAARSSLV